MENWRRVRASDTGAPVPERRRAGPYDGPRAYYPQDKEATMATHNSNPTRRRRSNPAEQEPRSVHEEDASQPSGGTSGPPSHEAIAARAYALFLARGGAHGDDWAVWLQAEAKLRAEGTPATDPSESEQSARG